MQRRFVVLALSGFTLALSLTLTPTHSAGRVVGVNVLLNTGVTDAILTDLSGYGRVRDVLYEIDAVAMQAPENQLEAIRARPYVVAASPDAERHGAPVDTIAVSDFAGGLNTWDLDAENVTNFGAGRQVAYDGSGVYVAVLDTGLLDSWRQYFPQERIATQFAKAFAGGGALDAGAVAEPTHQWEHDQNSHGTHVTSTILGYSLRGTPVNGMAPKATVIPVKVLGQSGSGWSSMVARGIVYATSLKAGGALGGAPLVINMSLGGSRLDPVEQAAIDYAVANGVIVVASAGNEGEAGMGYPGAYAPVISVAAAGWKQQWPAGNRSWWFNRDVPEGASPSEYYIAGFSSRELAGQDLDVVAPGAWIVGPYQLQSGKTSYFFLSGTSMSSPHVAGIAALMMQKNPGLAQGAVETLLEGAAQPMGADCETVNEPSGPASIVCWGADATGAGFITADAALAVVP